MTKNDRKYKTRSERNKETQSEIEDQGKNQKKYLFVVLALIIIILIVLYSIFSNSADDITEDTTNEVQTTEVTVNEPSENSENSEETTDTSDDTTSDSSEEDSEPEEETDEENEIDTESLEEAGLELVEPESDDAIGAYTGDWEPIGTEQTGEHATSYAEGSQDRIEIKQAAASVTGLNPDAMIEHWVGNDGTADGVHATVSDAEQTELYRVHLQWQDGAGWQPTVVEILN